MTDVICPDCGTAMHPSEADDELWACPACHEVARRPKDIDL